MTVTGKTLGENIEEYDVRGANAGAAARLLDPGPCRRRAHQPGVDGPQRRGRGPIAGRRAGRARSRRRDPATTNQTRRTATGPGQTATVVDDGFDPFDVIRTVENAYSTTGGLSMLKGNLAPRGAVVKTAGVSPKMLKHTGPAVIFESEIDAYQRASSSARSSPATWS